MFKKIKKMLRTAVISAILVTLTAWVLLAITSPLLLVVIIVLLRTPCR